MATLVRLLLIHMPVLTPFFSKGIMTKAFLLGVIWHQ
jgi:hypothetical protein